MRCRTITMSFLLAGVVLSLPRISEGQTSLTHGPILGAVTSEGVKVWVRGSGAAPYDVAYAPSAGGSELTTSTALNSADDFTGVLDLAGLDPSTEYDYRVLLDGTETFAGTFTTLPPTKVPGQIRFTYGADFALPSQPYVAFDPVIARQPDFMILGGDQIYADFPTVIADTKAAYEDRYKVTWADPKIRSAMQQIPMFMQWDDHEIFQDWSSGPTGRYVNARIAFDEYQGSHNPGSMTPGEIYYSFSAAEVDFFVMDTRSHRSPNSTPDGPTKTMLGATQRTALLDWLDTATGKFKFIVSSVPFHDWSLTADDPWHGFANTTGGFLSERNLIFEYIRDHEIPGVVLLSGDNHESGAFRLTDFIPYSLYEFAPSPMGHITFGLPVTDPQILYKNSDFRGFGMFTIDTTVEPGTLLYEWIDESGTVQFELSLTEEDMFRPSLELHVNRLTGLTQIVGVGGSGAVPVSIDGYRIESAVGSINPTFWNSFEDQELDGDTWDEASGDGTANQLAELNPDTSAAITAPSTRPIGAVFQPNFVTLGQETEDLVFTYTTPTGNILEGLVNYVGRKQHNNLVLVVDPASGAGRLQNESEISVDIDGYNITSESGSLLDTWNSLDDQGAAGGNWDEANPSANQLAELQADGVTTLNQGDGFDLGTLFNTTLPQDLKFEFLLSNSELGFLGVVLYEALASAIDGDYDNSGDVGLTDLNLVLFNWSVNGADLTTDWINQRPAADTPVGLVELNGVLFNWGNMASVATVPEPASLVLLLPFAVFVMTRRNAIHTLKRTRPA